MKIAIRVDVSSQIGTGHIMRCLTLADMFKHRGAQIRFVSRNIPVHLQTMLMERGHEFRLLNTTQVEGSVSNLAHSHWLDVSQQTDVKDTMDVLADQIWDWVIVDHYALDANWESAIRPIAEKIMIIDDIADRKHDCDFLLDQNFYTDMETRYEKLVPENCQLLLGPRYALLRDEFRKHHLKVKLRNGAVDRVLVFFGGFDKDNYTALAIDALVRSKNENLRVDVVIGLQHPARIEIEATCARHGFHCHVQADNMAELMTVSDIAIGAGGAVTWERCCLGLPTIALCIADNQKRLIEDAAEAGLIYAPQWSGDIVSGLLRHFQNVIENPALRGFISRNGMNAVDGRGTLRLASRMGVGSVKVRLAGEKDSADIMTWRNHPSIRAVSRNKEPVSAENHQRWLLDVLQDKNRALLIGYLEVQQPVGAVRFDIENNSAEISIYLAPGLSEKGLGTQLLQSSEQWLMSNRPEIKEVWAKVLEDNTPSHRLFINDGYIKQSTCYSKRLQQV